ncbi:MAG: alpha-ketoglutarate-dependent dioxygenase AlkB [Bacteroidetes bacterium]|nr:alpha-ketoglutarate-dependent dioxygenase AlkB [Bacteroidota bacterium]
MNLCFGGQDSIGRHADDESELGVEPIVASVSLGETRVFRLKKKRRYESRSE